tara:strand:- start:991 stop:2517 length:1527 start_codon:yes stop_codon:yes gene_type:complete
MPDRIQTYPVQFEGGLVTNLSTLQQGLKAPGSARTLINLEPSVEGGYRRIEGFTKFDDNQLSGSGLVRGLTEYRQKVYAARNEHLYQSAGSGWTQVTDNASFSSTGITLDDSANKVRFTKVKFGLLNKNIVIFDGVSRPFLFDNVALTEITGGPQNAALGVEFKHHLFIAAKATLVFSAPYSSTDFTPASGAGTITLEDEITGLSVFRDQLIVFTKRSIKFLTGSSIGDFTISPITDDLGCVEFDTIQEFGGDIMFMSQDGLRLLSGTERNNDFGLGSVSKAIQSEATDFQRFSSSFHSILLREKSQYRVFGFNVNFSDESSRGIIATSVMQGNSQNIAWAETRGINAYVCYSEYVANQEEFYFANDDGYVYEMESGNSFDGKNIPFTFSTPFLPITDPVTRKTIHSVDTYLDPQGSYNYDISLRFDFNNSGVVQPAPIEVRNNVTTANYYGLSTYGTSTFGGFTEFVSSTPTTGSGDVVSIIFEGDSTDPPFAFDSVVIQYGQYGRR